MKEDRISTILNWPEPESVREVQSFLRFSNFYCRFVKEFFIKAHSITDMSKMAAKKTKKYLALRKKDFLTLEAQISIQELVITLTNLLFLVHFDAKRPTKLRKYASSFPICGILLQKQETEWKVVSYFSYKMINAERNCKIHDAELLAIVESLVIAVINSSNRITLWQYSTILETCERL